jgi:hypothetical protein
VIANGDVTMGRGAMCSCCVPRDPIRVRTDIPVRLDPFSLEITAAMWLEASLCPDCFSSLNFVRRTPGSSRPGSFFAISSIA